MVRESEMTEEQLEEAAQKDDRKYQRTSWKNWVRYCDKVLDWYRASHAELLRKPELEPWGMNPPCEAIVQGTLFADSELKRQNREAAEHTRWVLLNAVDKYKLAIFEKALKSISDNTCCYVCQEAAKVARAALKEG